ncbi:hypothetical protein NX784_26825 [Massilia pinisoli]|uniref:Uncharacterized protein n=1 Tax=Massilia pinisoli TaxID=1772194 RepID=A0ABT1ZZ45_9BURK|nr:hypothetical protein [Massilia pinisoli]MCS0585201.1 hypothetical protein [Massilia pinisoli]
MLLDDAVFMQCPSDPNTCVDKVSGNVASNAHAPIEVGVLIFIRVPKPSCLQKLFQHFTAPRLGRCFQHSTALGWKSHALSQPAGRGRI